MNAARYGWCLDGMVLGALKNSVHAHRAQVGKNTHKVHERSIGQCVVRSANSTEGGAENSDLCQAGRHFKGFEWLGGVIILWCSNALVLLER